MYGRYIIDFLISNYSCQLLVYFSVPPKCSLTIIVTSRGGVWGWQVGRPPQAPLFKGPRASGLWVCQPTIKKQINETTIAQFKLHLSDENWLDTFSEKDMDSSFNNFLNVYLRHYYHSFPLKKYYNNYTKQGWLTKGIKMSCQHKRELYTLCKNTNNFKIINYYKTYCKILSKVIKTAKRHHINNLIKCSKNKTKTM